MPCLSPPQVHERECKGGKNDAAQKPPIGPKMAIMSTLSGLSLVLVGVVPTLWAGAIGFALSSLTVTTWNILTMSLHQSVIPGRLLGRVHGTWRTLLWGTMPVCSLIGGRVARVDLALPLIVGGVLVPGTSLLFFRFLMTLPNPEDVDNGDRPSEPGPTDPMVTE